MSVSETATSALTRVEEIIKLYGPRLCGDESTHKAAEYLKKDMENYCDTTKLETFKVNPKAFLSWVKIADVLYVISIILAWMNVPIFGALSEMLIVMYYVFENVLFMKFADRFFPEKIGKNVYGIIEPTEEVKNTVVYSGHHDSAFIFGFYEFLPNLFIIRAAVGLLTPLVFSLAMFYESFLLFQSGQGQFNFFGEIPALSRKMNIFFLFYTPIALSSWNFVKNTGTPGAGDNLIASSIGVELAKYFSEHRPKNTRVVIASFDGEEAGLRGARAFWDAHAKEYQDAYNFNVDSPFFLKELTLLKSDINGFQPLDQKMVDDIIEIGKKNNLQVNQKDLLLLLGGTDAAEAARHGVRTTTLIGLPWTVGNYQPVYHTMLDKPENVEPEAVDGVFTLAREFILSKDQ